MMTNFSSHSGWRMARDQAAAPPQSFQLDRREANTWSGFLNGPVEPFVAWLAGRPIEDVSIGRPDLDTLFRHYYAAEEKAS